VPGSEGSGGTAAGKPIILGSVGTYSGIVGNSLKGGLVAAQAWMQATNAAGGIAGHPVELVVADDGADPARHQQLVQQLVEQRNVKAFIYNAEAVTGQGSVRYLTQRRVPVIGSEGAGEWFYQSPMYFPQAPHGTTLQRAALAGAADLLVPQGKTKLGMIACTEAQFCNDAARIWPELARKVGFELVHQARASIAQPSFTAECLGAKNAGVQFLFIVEDANTFGRVARDCRAVDFAPVFGLVSANTQDRHKDDPNLDGAVVPVPMVPWFTTANPEIARFQDALQRYAPSATADGSTENGWVAARLFEAAARRSPDPTSSAGILDGLWALRGETVGGVTGALTFPKDGTAPRVTCWAHVVAKRGKWDSPTGGTLSCRNDL
jgi:branched-chain amino acid transport system substrate-binding protein